MIMETTVEATTVLLVAMYPNTVGPMVPAPMRVGIAKIKGPVTKTMPPLMTRWVEVPTIVPTDDVEWTE